MVGPGAAKVRIPEAKAFQFSGSAFSATVKGDEQRYDKVNDVYASYETYAATFLGNATPANIIPAAATQFTCSNNTTTIIVYS